MSGIFVRLPVAMTEAGSDYAGPLSTYPEWHALALGAGLGVALVASLAIGQTLMLLAAGAVVRAVYYAHTGKRAEIAGKKIDMPTRYLRQIRKEPHYLDGGVVLGTVTAAGVELVTVGHVVAPTLA